eukprot:1784820-Alexandrium_andersonii.AAC.1
MQQQLAANAAALLWPGRPATAKATLCKRARRRRPIASILKCGRGGEEATARARVRRRSITRLL